LHKKRQKDLIDDKHLAMELEAMPCSLNNIKWDRKTEVVIASGDFTKLVSVNLDMSRRYDCTVFAEWRFSIVKKSQ